MPKKPVLIKLADMIDNNENADPEKRQKIEKEPII